VKILSYLIALVLGLLGLLFVVAAGAGNAAVRIVIGVICLVAAGLLIGLSRLQPVHTTHVHRSQVDLSGDVSLENLTCRKCGAPLSPESVRLAAGAVFVKCEFCGAEYQLEEAPKW
jgi:hypothetical protein